MSAPPVQARLGPWLAGVAVVVVAATLVAAFLVMRSPSQQRQVTIDQRRVDELQRLGHAIDAYVVLHGGLPPELGAVAKQPGSALPLRDPVSGRPYEYSVLGEDRYRLCAVFATDTADTGDAGMFALAGGQWRHGSGHHCFERIARQRASAAKPR